MRRANDVGENGGEMSQRNGDRARFHKDRKRKLLHRQRIRALQIKLRVTRRPDNDSPSSATRRQA
jgi:hypothetical protein